jgi:hypothetical protein
MWPPPREAEEEARERARNEMREAWSCILRGIVDLKKNIARMMLVLAGIFGRLGCVGTSTAYLKDGQKMEPMV